MLEVFLLLGYPDSNQERQDQNLQCYHYTIPQCYVCYRPFVECGCKGSNFSLKNQIFLSFFFVAEHFCANMSLLAHLLSKDFAWHTTCYIKRCKKFTN